MKKILVADDDPHILKLIETRLAANHYEIITASDGLQAFEKIKSSSPDLIVLDELMPGLSGYHIATELKKTAETANIPIIIISAKTTMQYLFEELGVFCFLSKPFDPQELLRQVQRAIGKPPEDETLADGEGDSQDQDAENKNPEQIEEDTDYGNVSMTGGFHDRSFKMSDIRHLPDTVQEIQETMGDSEKILIAGPQKFILESLQEFVKTLGYSAILSFETNDAVKQAAKAKPAFIFAEIVKGRDLFDCEQFYRVAKENPETRQTPFVAFCYESVEFEEDTLIPGDRILIYSEFNLSDLKKGVHEFLDKFKS